MKIISELAQRLKYLGSSIELPKGAQLFQRGESPKGVFVINAGRAYVSLSNDEGKPIWSRIVGPGAVLGLPSSMGRQPYGLTAVALDKVNFDIISDTAVRELMSRDPEVSTEVVRVLSEELRELRRKMALLNSSTPKARELNRRKSSLVNEHLLTCMRHH
jgi:CRP/FNR family transcriptional regulator, polysaccharide utilization system transcription regulator